jgi:hypothetical protein
MGSIAAYRHAALAAGSSGFLRRELMRFTFLVGSLPPQSRYLSTFFHAHRGKTSAAFSFA